MSCWTSSAGPHLPQRVRPCPAGWRPGDRPRFPEYVAAYRYAVSGTALGRSVRVARPTVPRILLPFKITVKGALAARRCAHRRPLSSDLARKTHGTYQLGRGGLAGQAGCPDSAGAATA